MVCLALCAYYGACKCQWIFYCIKTFLESPVQTASLHILKFKFTLGQCMAILYNSFQLHLHVCFSCYWQFFFFLCGMHHWGCVATNADISLQNGRFWATVIASSRERLLDLSSCWIVFIHVVRGRPDGLLQFSEGEAVMILLASVSSGILALWQSPHKNVFFGFSA